MARLIEWNVDEYKKTEVSHKPLAKLPAPGPYTVEIFRDGGDCWTITDRNEKAVAYYGWGEECDSKSEQIESDLELLAAAPELLHALIYLSEECAKMPWSLLTGGFIRALKLSGRIVFRFFGDDDSMYKAFRNEALASIFKER